MVGGVEVETGAGSYRDTAGCLDVRHVAAVPDLDRCLGSPLMDAVGDVAEWLDDLGTQPQLRLKRKCRPADAGICEGGHSHSSLGYAPMVVAEHVRRIVVAPHPFECGAPDRPVAELYGTDLARSEESVEFCHHM